MSAWLTQVYGQLPVTAVDSNFTVNFDSTVVGVNNGAVAGTGFTTEPAVGELDADAFEILGMSSGSKLFGDIIGKMANCRFVCGKFFGDC
jgi:hypothetical protein